MNKTETTSGVARIPDIAQPNKLKVNFNIEIFGQTVARPDGDYNVWDTDYDSYTIVYSCSETNLFFFTVKSETAWILSRTKVLNEQTLNMARSKIIKGPGVDINKMAMADQAYCS